MSASRNTGPNATPVMGRPKDVNDGAVPSGNAVALHALARLARRPGSSDEFFASKTSASALLSAFARAVNNQPSAFTYLLHAAQVNASGESGPLQYAAHGGVNISAHANASAGSGTLVVDLEIQPGWHINAHETLSENLIPTTLGADPESSAWDLMDVVYPRPITKALGFQSEELALYEGSVRLTARLRQAEKVSVSSILRIKLRLQACDDKVCLPPENVGLQVPVR
jgi:hypothetical protein